MGSQQFVAPPAPPCTNDPVNGNQPVLATLANGTLNASKPTVGAGGVTGSSSVLADMGTGVQPHGKKG